MKNEDLLRDFNDEHSCFQVNEEKKENGEKESADGGKDKEDMKGVPEFWLTIFKNIEMIQDMIQEHDEPALAALNDVKVTFSDGKGEAPMVSETKRLPLFFVHSSGFFGHFEKN